MIRLALLRHGHTDWNRQGRIQGRSDIPLDRDAKDQHAALKLPTPWQQAALYASPLRRAVETAELVANKSPTSDPALMEMNWGLWEGQHGKTLKADPTSGFEDIEHWGWDFTPPGGESPAALRERLVPWANSLNQDSVAVCHIGVMRVLLAHASGWAFDGPAPFAVKRTRLYVIEIDAGTWHMVPEPIRLEAR